MADLKAEFIKCRDALACAINWLEPPEPPDVEMKIPADKLEWLNERLMEATILADRLASGEDVTLEDILEDEDYLRMAVAHDDLGRDAVELCESVSRAFNVELTIEQAWALLGRAEEICGSCLTTLNDEGYCDPCSEPESAGNHDSD